MSDLSDEQLVKDYNSGRPEALEELVRRFAPQVFGLALRFTADPILAEDLSQEAFIKAWKALPRFKPDGRFKSWFMTIARNTCLDYVRKRRPLALAELPETREQELLSQLRDPEPLPQEVFDRHMQSQTIQAHIDRLPEHYRTAVLLHLEEGLSFREIGEMLGVPLDTAKSRYFRALRQLRAWMTESP